jgi:hypothetical protein
MLRNYISAGITICPCRLKNAMQPQQRCAAAAVQTCMPGLLSVHAVFMQANLQFIAGSFCCLLLLCRWPPTKGCFKRVPGRRREKTRAWCDIKQHAVQQQSARTDMWHMYAGSACAAEYLASDLLHEALWQRQGMLCWFAHLACSATTPAAYRTTAGEAHAMLKLFIVDLSHQTRFETPACVSAGIVCRRSGYGGPSEIYTRPQRHGV